jgi:hypothetical protein
MSLKYNTTLTKRDIAHCRETFLSLRNAECETGESVDPETIMTSIGYVDVYPDGEVVVYNSVVARFDDDGDLVYSDDGSNGEE